MYAVAIDLGTTTLAASLLDCSSGRRLYASGCPNPQVRFGADVISRLTVAVSSPEVSREMMYVIRAGLKRLGDELCRSAGIGWHDVQRIAIAGNPTMQHLLLGLDITSLVAPPFRPLKSVGTVLKAAGLGWDGSADIYVFPMPGGFVGGDMVAFVYGVGPVEITLFLDVGTNGEIALLTEGTVWATSAAAGPAFEGGNLSCGMAALPGAISSVKIENDRLKLEVIGGGLPYGLCGSAVLEVITELLRCNLLETNGRLKSAGEVDSNLAVRIIDYQGSPAFVLHRDADRLIVLTQNDIRQLQLAKAALRAGIEMLTERSRIPSTNLKQVILTGSFGAVLRAEWLKTIGIFDKSMVQTSRFTPDGVLAGVEKMLASGEGTARVEELAGRFRVVPLSGTPHFETLFMRSMDFNNR
jgi:uncharacterized 2Fe-2S/4Fe-4S cluster protein (DUF4445 family)